MSNWRDQFEEESPVAAATTLLGRHYHYISLLLLAVFAFWNRTRNWGRYFVDGQILFPGNDPWYHYRSVQYAVDHYPSTMPFDIWTNFPQGTVQGQFGTIYDQAVATIALIVGLGNPSDELIRQIALFAPAVTGTLVLIPAYLIGRRLGGRFAGVLGVAVVAFAPDRLLRLSAAGFFDHQVAEALLQAIAVLAIMVAVRSAEHEKPIYEILADREFDAIRRSLGWAILGGVAIAMYLAVWPPGVLLLGILGVFFLIHLSLEYVRGRSPEHAAFAGAVALTTTGLLQLSVVKVVDIGVASRSLLQPGLAFAVAFGCVFMAWLAREWDERDLTRWGYPAAVGGIIIAGAVAAAVLLPSLFGFFVNQITRVLGLGFATTATAGTIAEVQPLPAGRLFNFYKFAFFTAIAGAAILLAKQYYDDDPRGEHLLVVIWFVFIVTAALTQARFAYYLAVPVGVLNAAAAGFVVRFMGGIDLPDIELHQVMVLAIVLMLMIVPMFFVATAGGQYSPITRGGNSQTPGGGIVGWESSLSWLSENTPAEGQYANPDGEPMEYLGTFARTDDYDYPAGAYGIISWWDYGHWITAQGERIAVANPFQQHATDAARFLTSQNETDARQELSTVSEDDAETRYVMVDWKMAETESQNPVLGKFFAPTTFDPDTNSRDYYSRIFDTDRFQQTGSLAASTLTMRQKPAYYNSTAARLYLYHGSAQQAQPYVLDWSGQERQLFQGIYGTLAPEQGNALKFFSNMSAAQEFVEEDGTSQIGGFGPYPTHDVPAMEHYRLVHMSDRSGIQSLRSQLGWRANRDIVLSGLSDQLQAQLGANASQRQVQNQGLNFLFPNTPAWTKTFERVPGATIEGSGAPANANLTLRVPLDPDNGGSFTYTQRVQADADGEFTATVPYSTTGYSETGPEEGYTNVSVRATGPYRISTPATANESFYFTRYSATANVTEAQVVGATDEPVSVELTEEVLAQPEGGQGNETSGGSDGSTSDGSGADDSTSDGSTSDGTTSDGTQESLTDPARLVGDPAATAP